MQFIVIIVAVFLILTGSEVRAGDAQPFVNFFLDQIEREASRQQQLQYQKQIQRQNKRDWRLFQSAWKDCFDRNDIARCDFALTYPNLGPQDRNNLLQHRQHIVAVQAENAAEAERANRARQQELAAAEARRVKNEDDQRERQRLKDQEQQQAEAERVHKASEAEAKSVADAANVPKTTAELPGAGSNKQDNGALVTGSIDTISPPLPMTQVMSVVVGLLALAGALLAFGRRPFNLQWAPVTVPGLSGIRMTIEARLSSLRRVQLGPGEASGSKSPEFGQSPSAPSERPPPNMDAEQPRSIETKATIQQTIDTPTALRALRLAQSYLEETDGGNFVDPESARTLRTTLALASRQLDIAFCSDPNAKLETEDGETLSQAHLRSRILCQEALTWELENLSKATAIAERAAIADPDFAGAFHILGVLNYENRNKDAAVAALTKASELNPDNIEIFKLLDRAQSMGAAEIATFKATRAGVRAANAGIGVYNAGIRVRNFFVIIWNVFATVYNVITWPLRLVSKVLRFF